MRSPLPAWLSTPVLGASAITVFAGAAQFGVTAALGDVAIAFGVATTNEVQSAVGGLSAGDLGDGLAVIRFAGIGALFGSVLADRLGRRTVLLWAAALGLTATALATTMPTFWTFVFVIALGRPLLTTTNAIVPVVAAEESTTQGRTWALAFVAAMYALGAGLISVVRAASDGIGHRPLLLGAGATVLLLPLVARWVRDSPASLAHADTPRPRFGLVDRAHVRPLVVLCVLAVLTNLVTGPALTWLFAYGEGVLSASRSEMALLVFLAGPVGAAGLLLGRFAADRAGRRTAAVLGTAALPAAAVLTYTGTVPTLQVGYLATIFCSALFGPPVAALLNELMPTEVRATANGWVGAAAVVGGVAGLSIFGRMVEVMPSYTAAASTLFLPVVPLAFGYFLLPREVSEDVAEIDRLLAVERATSRVTDA